MIDKWWIETCYAHGGQRVPWSRPTSIKLKAGKQDAYRVDQPVSLEQGVEWIAQYDEAYRPYMRLVNEDGTTIVGEFIVGYLDDHPYARRHIPE